jgi:hypothetical protein
MRGKRSEQPVVQIVRKKEMPFKPKRQSARARAEIEAIAATQAEPKIEPKTGPTPRPTTADDQAWKEAEAKQWAEPKVEPGEIEISDGGLGDGEVEVDLGADLESAPGRLMTAGELNAFMESGGVALPKPDGLDVPAAEPWQVDYAESVTSEALERPDRRGVTASVDRPSIANPATLAGDMRDLVLDLIQRQEKTWAKMLNYEQAVLADKLMQVCKQCVDGAVAIALDTPLPYITVTLDRISLDKDIKLTISSPYNGSALAKVGEAIHKQATLVLVSPEQFKGERDAPRLDPDQAALSLGEDEDD